MARMLDQPPTSSALRWVSRSNTTAVFPRGQADGAGRRTGVNGGCKEGEGSGIVAAGSWVVEMVDLSLTVVSRRRCPVMTASASMAAPLSKGTLPCPHLGEWMQDGQPASQGQPATNFSVRCDNSGNTSNSRA